MNHLPPIHDCHIFSFIDLGFRVYSHSCPMMGASWTMASKEQQQEEQPQKPICLDDEQEDEGDRKMPAQCSAEEPIDLCDSDNEIPAAAQARRKKRRRLKEASDSGIIGDPSDKILTPDESYRRALGPQRMEFVADFSCKHAFQGNASPARLPRTLTSELLEYKLNLPIAAHSSIFVRVSESRMDLLRVRVSLLPAIHF